MPLGIWPLLGLDEVDDIKKPQIIYSYLTDFPPIQNHEISRKKPATVRNS